MVLYVNLQFLMPHLRLPLHCESVVQSPWYSPHWWASVQHSNRSEKLVPLQASPGPAFIMIGMHRIIKSFIMATVPIDSLKTRYFVCIL